MKWFDILKRFKTGMPSAGNRQYDNEFNEERMRRAREFLDDEEEGKERDSKMPVPKGAFIKKPKPKPKQPQSKFADANPDKEPPNPFKKK